MVSSAGYIPKRGDAVWLSMDPRAGREQAGRRPAIVLTPQKYNGKVGLAIFCPITSQVKGYPFEVPIPDGLAIEGVILSDQVKSLDWRERRATFICELPEIVIRETLAKFRTLVG